MKITKQSSQSQYFVRERGDGDPAPLPACRNGSRSLYSLPENVLLASRLLSVNTGTGCQKAILKPRKREVSYFFVSQER